MRRAFLPTMPILAPTTRTASNRAQRVRKAHARLAIVPATMRVHALLAHAAQAVRPVAATADRVVRAAAATVDRKGRFGALFHEARRA